MGCLVAVVGFLVIVPGLIAVLGGLVASSVEPYEPPTPMPRPSSAPPAPPTPKPEPPTPKPAPPEPEPIPNRTNPPLPPPNSGDPAWVRVQQAAVYTASFPSMSGCPAPATLGTMAELQPYATAELACIQNAWRPVLATVGLPSAEVPHFFFSGSEVTSPCGVSTAPAYYCSANGGTIHIGEDLLLDTSWDPIWAKDVIGHEYGHHIQGVSGFFDAMDDLPPGNETIRRNEIQATCFSMGMLRRDDSVTLDRPFYDTLEPHLRSYLDDGTHGSPDSLALWGMRGFHATLAGECTTWLVGSDKVR
ncbi:hypothetical protein [Tessaracoccus antarcticus]|uniref:hypothetical protein n=1 Tax=Tessaracoccus antarcticus TaxID=2479848 RepID=UPI0013142038|nr:hypothetical protein [Tessaracoccus antarcticus]